MGHWGAWLWVSSEAGDEEVAWWEAVYLGVAWEFMFVWRCFVEGDCLAVGVDDESGMG